MNHTRETKVQVVTEDEDSKDPQITVSDIRLLTVWDGAEAKEMASSDDEQWARTVCTLLNSGIEWQYFDMGINAVPVDKVKDFSCFTSGETKDNELLDASHSYIFAEFYETQKLWFETGEASCKDLLIDTTWIYSADADQWTYLFFGNDEDFMDTVGALVDIE